MADISSVGLLGLELIEILRGHPGIRLELYWSAETRRWRGDLTTTQRALGVQGDHPYAVVADLVRCWKARQ